MRHSILRRAFVVQSINARNLLSKLQQISSRIHQSEPKVSRNLSSSSFESEVLNILGLKVFISSINLSSLASRTNKKRAEFPGSIVLPISLMKPSSTPMSDNAPERAPVVAPIATPNHGAQNKMPMNRPQNAPPTAPSPTRLTACLTLTLPSDLLTTTAASSSVMRRSRCRFTNTSRTSIALVSLSKANTINSLIVLSFSIHLSCVVC